MALILITWLADDNILDDSYSDNVTEELSFEIIYK